MPVTIHFSNETSAWRYLLPALLTFSESHFSWETCRFSEAYLDADKALLRDNQNIFSFVPLGRESFVAKWLKLNGAPSSDINVYAWGCFEPSLVEIPFIQLPRLRDDQNGFLLNLKSLYPHRSLSSLTNERSVHPRNRIHLRKLLMPELTAALSKQLAAASRLQSLPLASDREDSSIIKDEQLAAKPRLTQNIQSRQIEQLDPFDNKPQIRDIVEPIASTSKPIEPEKSAQVQQPLIQEEDEIEPNGDYSVVDVHQDFTIDEVQTSESEHCPHWSIAFTDNQYLPIFTHIDRHGCITESEVVKLLGSARLARKFTTQIETYSELLPFDVNVQSSPSGNRYTKSTI
jgi:hypothetical protein